ncbi:hypothetical protein [Corynebacterium sp. 335C]
MACAAALVAGAGAGGAATAEAMAPPFPISPSAPEISEEWVGQDARIGADGPLELRMTAVSPRTPAPDGDLTVRLTLVNRSNSDLTDVRLRAQRRDALESAGDAGPAMADPESAFGVATSFGDPVDVPAGESRKVSLTVPLGAAAPEGLGVPGDGVYPVLINANGRLGDGIVTLLAETRTLVPVLSGDDASGDGAADGEDAAARDDGTPSGDVDADGDGASAGAPDRGTRPVGLSMLWPLAQDIPLVPGETGEAPDRPQLILADESLAESMADGGRLDGMLDVLEQEIGPDSPLRPATCVAVEPELLLTAHRMAGGYLVADERPSPVEDSTRLRDSWGGGNRADGAEGEGADEAAAWLDRLRDATDGMCVVAMPWGAADAGAVAVAAQPAMTGGWLDGGERIVAEVLERPGLPRLLLPPEGYLTADAVRTVSGASDPSLPRTAIVAGNTLSGGEPGQPADLAPGLRAVGAPTALTTALAGTGALPETPGFAPLVGRHRLDSDSGPARMQAAVGVLHQEIVDRAGAGRDAGPILAVPPAGWSPSPESARAWAQSVADLRVRGAVEPASFVDLVDAPAAGAAETVEPVSDPGALTGTEVRRGAMQAGYVGELTAMMSPAPDIALTPAEFTRPLLRDELRAMSTLHRRSRAHYDRAVDRTRERQAATGAMLQQLRQSVRLLPPAGLYTRTTGASPVAVVARNGLPLPVEAEVVVQGDALARPLSEPTLLPAKGALTLQLQPDIDPGRDRRATLTMWLRTPEGTAISDPVEVVVRSGPSAGVVAALSAIGLLSFGVAVAAVARTRRRRRAAGQAGPREARGRRDPRDDGPERTGRAFRAGRGGRLDHGRDRARGRGRGGRDRRDGGADRRG